MKFSYSSLFFFTLFSKTFLLAVPSAGLIDDISEEDPNVKSILTAPTYQTGIDGYGNTTIAFANTSTIASGNFLQAVTLFPQVTFESDGETVNNTASIARTTFNDSEDFTTNTNLFIPTPYPFTPSLTTLNIDRNFRLAVSISGNAILVWTRVIGSKSVLFAAYLPLVTPPSTFGEWRITQLSDSSFTVTDFSAAIDESGNAVVAWRLSNGIAVITNGAFDSTSVVQAAYTDPANPGSGNWFMATQPTFTGTPPTIPLPPNNQDFTLSSQSFNVTQTPAVGIAQGNATVAWQISNGQSVNRLVVQAAYKTKAGGFIVYDSANSFDINPTNQNTVLSSPDVIVSSFPRVTAYAETSVVTWQIQARSDFSPFPINAIQAFVKHF